MEWLTNRRTFLESMALGGAASSLMPKPAVAASGTAESFQIENQFFQVGFDVASGRLHAWRKQGTPFLTGATSRVVTASGVRSTADPEYQRTVEVQKIKDSLGIGAQLVARCHDARKALDFEIRCTLYDGLNAWVTETICRNVSSRNPVTVHWIEPLRAIFCEDAACHWGGVEKVLTNGYMYYDPGRVEEFEWASRHATQSMWNMGFHRGKGEGLVVGFLNSQTTDGRISAWCDHTVTGSPLSGGFSLICEALCNEEMVLKPGASARTGGVILLLAPDTFTALESYAEAAGKLQQVRLNRIINGWCSWSYTHRFVTEEEVLRNTEFAAQRLKPFGLEYIQIDSGYQRAYGDWEGGENFPHGMKWMAGKIRETGLKPGLWVAPFAISGGTEVQQQHPEWLVRNLNGGVKLCRKGRKAPVASGGSGDAERSMNIYGLDITHPDAARWVRSLFDRIASDWGYDFIKIDYVEWTLLAAERYYNASFSKAAAYRRGIGLIRQGIGQHRHLLDCGPMNNTVGLLDSARIELDLPHLTWNQYAGRYNSNAAAMARRYYFHKRTWINDDDHLGLALLTIPQAQAAASIIALSGGTMISGDRLIDLDPARLEILKKVFPSYGEAARPVDLFERDEPEIFALPVKASFAEWLVVGVFNYDEHVEAEKQVMLDRLRLDPAKEYVTYDFWRQRLYGEVQGELRIKLEPSSVALLSVHEKKMVPQVLSTDRHFSQGGIELESAVWDAATSTLRGVSLGPPESSHSVSIYFPERFAWAESQPDYFYDFAGYTLKQMDPRILRVYVSFKVSGRVAWEAKFRPVF